MKHEDLKNRLDQLVECTERSGRIDQTLYQEYDVYRGLRDAAGRGVLTGLTEISDVNGTCSNEFGERVPCDGNLFYQGYNIRDLIAGAEGRNSGFEEITYLLLFGDLPTAEQLEEFVDILNNFRDLPESFTRDVIMKASSTNMMNSLQKSVLTLYSYDQHAEDTDPDSILKQCLSLIAKMPLLAVYGYNAYKYYHLGMNLHIRNPKPELPLAENLLQMLHSNGEYTAVEAKALDTALILHAEHGGGNNSTFTTHVVSSTGTDTYSAVAASLGSLKGPRHGGANHKVQAMMEDIKAHVKDWEDEKELKAYLDQILDRQAFDRSGLIYGLGHAIYTLSDPRAVILKEQAAKLAEEKGLEKEFRLYENVERLGKQSMAEKLQLVKPVCANVDFYSGFVYRMLDFPQELFTPLFAIARITGWSAHRIEETVNAGKIIRPAYKYIGHHRPYTELSAR